MDQSTAHGSHDLNALADTLAGTFPGACDAGLAVALVRLLAHGEPVADRRVADVVGRDQREVTATLAGWPNVQRDEQGHVIAFGGLTLRATAHRFDVAGRRLHTWCAWDTLFLPAMIGERATVHSRCGLSGAPVRLTVDPDRVSTAEPEGVSVSFPALEATRCEDITGTFCCHVHFLAGPHAEHWRDSHDGAFVLSLDDAFALGRLAIRACLTAV